MLKEKKKNTFQKNMKICHRQKGSLTYSSNCGYIQIRKIAKNGFTIVEITFWSVDIPLKVN